jgi:hypothetical protein
MKLKLFSTGLFTLLFFNTNAQITIPLTPTQDNSIYSESNNSNGQGKLYAGRTCTGDLRRALMQYDFSAIPPGSIITNVTLSLNVDSVSPSAPPSSVFTLHKVNSAWGEGMSSGLGQGAPAIAPDATWTDAMFGTAPWIAPGGDFITTPSASQTLTNTLGNYTWSGAGLINDVQAWVDNTTTNNGWILIGDESVNCTSRRFGSNNQGITPSLIVEYICTYPPFASCQNFTAYLDQNGLYVIQPSDIDNGSISICGAPIMFNVINPTLSCSQTPNNASSLIISAVFDATLTGGQPKGVELYVINDISDLSIYGLGSANNGGGTDGIEFTFPSVSATAGDYIYVCADSASFATWFGFAPDYVSSALNVNGDDAIELFKNTSVIDVFGDINTDGTGQPWEYMDGWASRNINATLNFGVFNISDWTFSGPNALDGESDNATAATPIPVGVFTTASTTGVNITLEVTDQSNNMTSTCVSVVTVLDTVPPTVNCIGGSPTFSLDATGNFTLQVSDIDNGSTGNCGDDSLYLSQTNFNCSNIGVNTVTLYATDASGNIGSCTMDINISGTGGVSIDSIASTPPSCFGACDATLNISASNAVNYSIDGGATTQSNTNFNGLCEGVYNVWVSNSSGCSAQMTYTIAGPTQIVVSSNNINPSCNGVCDGQIEINATGGSPVYVYSIDGGATNANDSTFNNLCEGIYNLVVTDSFGCADSSVYVSLVALNTIDDSISVNGAVLTASENGAQYQWIDCDNGNAPIAGETGQSFTATQNGNYAVIITVGSCSDTSTCSQVTGIGLNDNQIIDAIYPNPTNGVVTLALNNPYNLISVMDINGKVIKTIQSTSNTTTINLAGYENGIYFIKVDTDHQSIIKKISLIK